MIISASRRTDIPAFHAEWMMERLRAGYALVRNPFNPNQISRVSLAREDAELIVFWTKNAHNMLHHLPRLDDMGYRYMFQYTFTPYGENIERNVHKKGAFDAMLRLSERIGEKRVIWRYDPILLTEEWTAEKHLKMFSGICRLLEGRTKRCVISFVDLYRGVRQRCPWIQAPDERTMRLLAREMAACARTHGMIPSACAEEIDLTEEGLEARGCIDAEDVAAVLGAPVDVLPDVGQRNACRCVRSVDIGAYDTCGHGCVYCYARTGRASGQMQDAHEPMLGGPVPDGARISERTEKRILREQISFLD